MDENLSARSSRLHGVEDELERIEALLANHSLGAARRPHDATVSTWSVRLSTGELMANN